MGEDFPYVCEQCLGPNPYVRMLRGKAACKMTGRPFTTFRWRLPGGQRKETRICYEAAAANNACQACVRDMTFGVSLAVRNSVLTSKEGALMPISEVGQAHFFEKQMQMQKEGASIHPSGS